MTVKDLISKLKEYHPNHIVITATDPEGNNFSVLSDDIGIAEWDEENQEPIFEDEDTEIEPDAIVLWP